MFGIMCFLIWGSMRLLNAVFNEAKKEMSKVFAKYRPDCIVTTHFSPNYVAQVMNYLNGKNFAINVISKSGTTTETSISFRLLKELLEKQIGKEKAKKAIYATTDKEKGALKTL